tara:strand:- start:2800 stop:3285 length:486 start_codon:yes stop_codon:yes gene_type:complete
MQIATNTAVQFHYSLKNEQGEELDNSHQSGQPMTYLHGHGTLLKGLEDALTGKTRGDTLSITLPPEAAFGERKADSQARVPVKHLHGAKKWQPGMVAVVQTDQGQKQVSIIKVGHTMATVDTNHPMAGLTLTFDVEVVDVREATAEELAHGHVHGPGGHHH